MQKQNNNNEPLSHHVKSAKCRNNIVSNQLTSQVPYQQTNIFGMMVILLISLNQPKSQAR